MALPALKSAMDTFAESPTDSTMGRMIPRPSSADYRQGLAKQVDAFARHVADWRSRTLIVRRDLDIGYRAFAKMASPDAIQAMLRGLEEFAAVIDGLIVQSQEGLDRAKKEQDQLIAEMARYAPDDARFTRKMARKLRDIAILEHNERVDFYYFLLSLQAEFDPEARGGPAFDKAEDLLAFLHSQTR
jgi:hypothetical protein